MRIAITGSSNDLVPHLQYDLLVSCRVETLNEASVEPFDTDVFINCAHVDFEQVRLFDLFYNKWKSDKSKHIINISSRAAEPNISKGKLYASQKAALNHYSNNVVYNDELKFCKVSTINLGLMNSNLPSLSWRDVAQLIHTIIDYGKKDIEIPEITFQHAYNYVKIQKQKTTLSSKV